MPTQVLRRGRTDSSCAGSWSVIRRILTKRCEQRAAMRKVSHVPGGHPSRSLGIIGSWLGRVSVLSRRGLVRIDTSQLIKAPAIVHPESSKPSPCSCIDKCASGDRARRLASTFRSTASSLIAIKAQNTTCATVFKSYPHAHTAVCSA